MVDSTSTNNRGHEDKKNVINLGGSVIQCKSMVMT